MNPNILHEICIKNYYGILNTDFLVFIYIHYGGLVYCYVPLPNYCRIAPHSDIQHTKGSVQDCSNYSALAIKLLQPCAKPSIQYNIGWKQRV